MLVRSQAQQRHPHQGSVLQVERRMDGGAQTRCQGLAVEPRRLLQGEAHRHLRTHALHRLAPVVVVGGAQRRMAVHQGLEGAPQRLGIQIARDPRRRRDVVGGARGRHPLQEPERPLAMGEGKLGGVRAGRGAQIRRVA
jgi:hypothetical protein